MFELTSSKRREGKDLMSFKRELDNLFNHFFDIDFPMPRRLFKDQLWTPRVDVSEGEKEITVKAEIPGCEAKDIDVSLEGRTLTIKGEKKQEQEEKTENLHRIERAYGFFSRTLELQAEVDQENIKASYKRGVLNLVFQKTGQAKGRKITIESN
jgi:HSP20 family protein